MTREMAEAEPRGGLNWLAASPIGPQIVFALDGASGEGQGAQGAQGGTGEPAASKGGSSEGGEGEAKPAKPAGGAEGAGGGIGAERAKEGDGAARPEDWRASIQDEKLREFAGKFASPADLAKTAFEFRQKLSKGIQPPGEDAADEEKAAFRKAIGIPDDKSGYKFEMPEGAEPTEQDKAFQSKMAEVMHAAGVPASAAQALNKAWNEMTAGAVQEAERVAKQAREAAQASLKKEWGADYDANFNLATRVIRAHAPAEFVDFLEKTDVDGRKLGDHPDMIRIFGNIGRRMDESGFIGAVSDDERSDAQGQIDQLMRDNPPGTDKYRDPAVQKRLRELNEKLHGTSPIVGTGGRTY